MPSKKKTKELQDPDVFWMIRNPSNGYFSIGGRWGAMNKQGKIYPTHGRLMAHLNLVDKLYKRRKTRDLGLVHPYANCEIVQYRRIKVVSLPCMGYGE